jgi:hypothetical protein
MNQLELKKQRNKKLDIQGVASNRLYRCLKIREFRIQSVVGKAPVELEKYLEKKNSLFLKKI